MFIGAEQRSAFTCLNLDRGYLPLKVAVCDRVGGTLLVSKGQPVLCLAADAIALGDVLGGDAHVNAMKRVVQHTEQVVLHLCIAHARPPAGRRQHIGATAHGLDTRANGEVGITEHQGVGRRDNGLQTRAAQAVNVVGRGVQGNAGVDGRDPPYIGILRLSGYHIAHHHMPDALRFDLAVEQRRLDRSGGQVTHGHVFECAAKGANGGALGTEDENVRGRHHASLWSSGWPLCSIPQRARWQSSPFEGQLDQW